MLDLYLRDTINFQNITLFNFYIYNYYMYRKGLSSRANKVSSLVASSDNAGTGTIEQASVPNAGVFGIRKNVFRNLPRIPPKKSVTPFSSMKSKPKSSEAESETSQPAPEPAAASFPLTLKFNSAGEQDLTPTSNTHVEFNSSEYTYTIEGMYSSSSPNIPNTGEIGIPIPLPDTLDYTNVNVQISWEELKVLSTYVGNQLSNPPSDKPKILIYLNVDRVNKSPGSQFYSNGSHYNTTGGYTPKVMFATDPELLTFTKDSLSLMFYNKSMDYSIFDSMTRTGYWDPEPLKISLKNLVVTISKPE